MFNTYLRESLEKLGNVKIEKTALKEQFETLLLTPLSAILPDDSGMMTRIIIIDALDECERYDHIPEILKMLAQLRGLRNVRFRVFLTCRSAPRIVSAFNDLNTQPGIYRCLALEKEFNKETKADISAFLRKTFANIRTKSGITIDPWPDPKDLNRLVSLATNPSPLFIYAATLCRFVYDEDDDWADPTERLNLWLAQCDRNVSQLEQIYKPILEQSFSGRYKEGQNTKHLNSERQSKVLQILGTIVLLTTPLPAGALATLLGIHKDAVNRCLRNLHAVLSVPSEPNAPVRVLHKSFSDFLLGQEGTGTADFQVDAVEIHAMLALKCIDSMNNGLRRDICNLQESGKLRVEIDKAIVARHIPPDLEYACLHWVYHLHSGQRTIDENIYAFLQQHFLHWIESLSLLGKLSDGVRSIRKLLYIAQVCL